MIQALPFNAYPTAARLFLLRDLARLKSPQIFFYNVKYFRYVQTAVCTMLQHGYVLEVF